MRPTHLDANTYGIGQLITQRKVFLVPPHQRAFAWTADEVEEYLDDIATAQETETPDYFVGLIVLQGPVEGAWQILDGQQRLATTTMIYSAIRQWLTENRFEADAKQIESEFIGVRQLGGKYSPRLTLNTDNRDLFDQFITNPVSDEQLQRKLAELARRSSNHRLLESARFCRDWIRKHVGRKSTVERSAQSLFSLSTFIENRVKVVCVEVGTTTDAYVLFESLNDRGVALSALDLIRNYVFSELRTAFSESLHQRWSQMIQNIDEKDADDFLRVFWTSRFGKIQKLQLFARIREQFPLADGAATLIRDLASASEHFSALDDSEHEVWQPFGHLCRQRIADLRTLGNRQSRPVILAAIAHFSRAELESLLWLLIVVVVRYQIVGRGRTGVMEREFAGLAKKIHLGAVRTALSAKAALSELLPNDDSFRQQFSQHFETNASRVTYFLVEIEAAFRSRLNDSPLSQAAYDTLRSTAERVSPHFLLPRPENLTKEHWEITYNIGNRFLIEDGLAGAQEKDSIATQNDILASSALELTRTLAAEPCWDSRKILARSKELADLASRVWATDQVVHP